MQDKTRQDKTPTLSHESEAKAAIEVKGVTSTAYAYVDAVDSRDWRGASDDLTRARKEKERLMADGRRPSQEPVKTPGQA